MYSVGMPNDGGVVVDPGHSRSGSVVGDLIALASLCKELQTQSHLIHLNYEGENFLSVHLFLKDQYEAHLEEFDTVSEFVRAQDHFMPMCACGLKEAMPAFQNVESYDPRQMLMTYLLNLTTLSEMATGIEEKAGKERVVDVQNYMAELVAAANKASWFVKATLRGC